MRRLSPAALRRLGSDAIPTQAAHLTYTPEGLLDHLLVTRKLPASLLHIGDGAALRYHASPPPAVFAGPPPCGMLRVLNSLAGSRSTALPYGMLQVGDGAALRSHASPPPAVCFRFVSEQACGVTPAPPYGMLQVGETTAALRCHASPPPALAFTRYCNAQYCMVYGVKTGGRKGVECCAIEM